MNMIAEKTVVRVLVLAAAAMVAAAWVRPAFAEDAKIRVAVVNAETVFTRYEAVKEISRSLKEKYKAKEEELESEKKRLEFEKDELTSKEPDGKAPSREFLQKANDLRLRMYDWEFKASKLTEEQEKEKKEKMEIVLRDMRAAIRAVAKEENVDVVLHAPASDLDLPAAGDEAGRQPPKTAAELLIRFRANPVLHFSPQIDLTEKVLNKLNVRK
jgi:Skp family chaperone for outer membrane proteins